MPKTSFYLIIISLLCLTGCSPVFYQHCKANKNSDISDFLPNVEQLTFLEADIVQNAFNQGFPADQWYRFFQGLPRQTKLAQFGKPNLSICDSQLVNFGTPYLAESLVQISPNTIKELHSVIEKDLFENNLFIKDGKVSPVAIEARLDSIIIVLKDSYFIPIQMKESDIIIGELHFDAYYDSGGYAYGFQELEKPRMSYLKISQSNARSIIATLSEDFTETLNLNFNPTLTTIDKQSDTILFWKNEDIVISAETGTAYQLFIQNQDLELIPYNENFPGYNDVSELWHGFDNYPFILKEITSN